jgi:hypothetical protein
MIFILVRRFCETAQIRKLKVFKPLRPLNLQQLENQSIELWFCRTGASSSTNEVYLYVYYDRFGDLCAVFAQLSTVLAPATNKASDRS